MYDPPADGLDLTMKGTLNVMFDYCSIPLGTYFKLGAQAGFLSNFEKSPYLCFWRSRLRKITYSVVTWDRKPQIIHTRYQNDRSKMTIILVYHIMALCRAHHLRKCEILGQISSLFFILLSH